MNKFPENFTRLYDGEEFVRGRSIDAIMQSDELLLHIAVTEKTADLIYHFIHRDEHKDDDDLTVRLLGIRLFNGLNSTLKLMLSGYYQTSTLQHRDLIETIFLLDYFQGNRSLIARWCLADDKIASSEFTPVKVRMALDARDAFEGKRRAEAYKIFSTLAAHPNPRGFHMLRLPDGNHHCGPFFEETAMKATVSELGKTSTQAGGIFGLFFEPISKQDYQVKLSFLEIQQAWCKRFFEKEPIDVRLLDEMRAMIACL